MVMQLRPLRFRSVDITEQTPQDVGSSWLEHGMRIVSPGITGHAHFFPGASAGRATPTGCWLNEHVCHVRRVAAMPITAMTTRRRRPTKNARPVETRDARYA